jgi:hypothetical protein
MMNGNATECEIEMHVLGEHRGKAEQRDGEEGPGEGAEERARERVW